MIHYTFSWFRVRKETLVRIAEKWNKLPADHRGNLILDAQSYPVQLTLNGCPVANLWNNTDDEDWVVLNNTERTQQITGQYIRLLACYLPIWEKWYD